ncbi:Uncharacterized protein GBIM_01856, partial [Gryllus bimaculatus]
IASKQHLTSTPEEHADTQCGLGRWRPSWLQRLASKKAYLILHGLIGFHQIAMGSYMVGTLSTIERRFKIPSKTTGLIAGVWELGALTSLLFVGYLGRQGHKPHMVAVATILMSIALLGRLLPHWVYGPGQDALELTKEYGDAALLLSNSSGGETSARGSLCGTIGSQDEDDCSNSGSLGAPAIILFTTNLILGVCSSVYWTLGFAYLDDNTHKDKAPLVLAATSCIRLLGPTCRLSLASYGLARYVHLERLPPHATKTTLDGIGAWWIW